MLKFIRISEIAYTIIAIISAQQVYANWTVNRNRAYLMLMFMVVSIIMIFVRRGFRKKMEARARQNEK